MGEVVRLKSRFVSSRPGREATHSEGDGAATRLVEGILRRKSFYFQQRTGKLDMRAIGRVDVDRVVKDVDIDTLQGHLENITFADVTEDDLRLYSDQCFLNLFRLSQLLLEYLLNVQDTLATSLEALALKHSSTRKAVDKGRAELHVASEQDRALKREIRQKRATIARYEQLLALPAPPAGGAPSGSNTNHGSLQACLTCGKMFTTTEFLQQHIVRKHASRVGTCNDASTRESGEAEKKGAEEEKAMFPSQLRLFVQTNTGQCLDMMVHRDATIAQLRGYIDSTAGFTAAGASKFLVYRGLRLHDGQTLKECNIPTDSQLVLLDSEAKETPAGAGGAKEEEEKVTILEKDGVGVEESAAVKKMSTLVDLMRQQMEWTMRSVEDRREQGLGAAEALETRMRGMEASLPRRLEEFMEESVGGLKSSLSKALGDMEELHAKRSNAGAIQDDEEETKRREEEEKSRLALLSADVERVSKENAALLQELADAKASAATVTAPSATPVEVPRPHVVQAITSAPPREQVPKLSPEGPVTRPPIEDPPRPQRKASAWDLTFPSQGSRRAVTIKVPRNGNCDTVCERIAEELDVVEARVVLRNNRGGAIVPPETLSGELQRLHEGECLELEVLQGTVLSDHVVDGLVDFYEQHVPVKARASGAISRSMAEMDETAKRHALGERNGMGTGAGKVGNKGGDATEHAEKQIDNIRAQLSTTLTAGRRPSNDTYLAKRNSISSNAPGLGLSVNARRASGGGLSDANMFDDGEGEHADLSRAELERAVEERKRARPAGIERQMESVSMSMEEQLNILLEEAEEELEQLEQDSLGSDTYSSTAPSVDGAVSTFADPLESQLRSSRDGRGGGMHQGDGSRPRSNVGRRASGAGSSTHASSHGRQSEVSSGRRKTRTASDQRTSRSSRSSKAREEFEDIPKSDWGRTLDTAVSIPEGPEERADEHEANASLEMMDGSSEIVTNRGQRT